MVVRTQRIPKPGETVMGGAFLMAQGGKGANQAVAAARLGADVTFITCLGSDLFGEAAFQALTAEAIDTHWIVRSDNTSSGVALICVDNSGENSIVVAGGANGCLMPQHVHDARPAFEQADIILTQLEIPLETVNAVIDTANSLGKPIILNPAPAAKLPGDVLKRCYTITPNETEAALLGDCLESLPSTHLVMTAGVGGVFVDGEHIAAPVVHSVDTTAAGDAFNGALAVSLARGESLRDACRFAVYAASLSVMRFGAQPSLPTLEEVAEFICDYAV